MILVFGKTGQIGSELQKFSETISLDRKQVDLTNLASCLNAIKYYRPNAVINAAAYTAVDMAEDEEELANLVNAVAPGKIAQYCADINIPFVHISTDYVFDGSRDGFWKETDPANPITAYGRSKLKGEERIKLSSCTYAILRTSWVFSAYGKNFVKTMLQQSKARNNLKVVDDQIGGPTYARDIAKACIVIADRLIRDSKKSGVYHLSGKPDVSWFQFAKTILKKAGRNTIVQPISSSEYPTSAFRPLNSRLDCALIKTNFNISRPHWADGLNDVLEDLKDERCNGFFQLSGGKN